jgi:catechol 2,3-dioxygenase-like lactoylglutathione lyase family enzyme
MATFCKTPKVITFIVTRDRARAKAFYGDTLGFAAVSEDMFATVFDLNGIQLRISEVSGHQPAPHTVLGWEVPDIEASVKALRAKGITFTVY